MTTKTDIDLLRCPFCGGQAEMDTRQGYLALGTGRLGNRIAVYCRQCDADMGVCIEDVPYITPEQVAEMWNRRAAVEADRREQMNDNAACIAKLSESDKQDQFRGAAKIVPSEELTEFMHQFADGFDIPPYRFAEAARALLSRYSSGQPAASAEPEWMFGPVATVCVYEGFNGLRYMGVVKFNEQMLELGIHELYAAPVVQEPVARANVYMHKGRRQFLLTELGTKAAGDLGVGAHDLFAAPVAAQAQPSGNSGELPTELDDLNLAYVSACEERDHLRAALAAQPSAQDREDDEALADTQRMIIEAAERRGYERGLAECAQVARAAKGAGDA